ncbi:DNA-binding transcriptional regulator, MocR family, contains an aminotransferase domain [Streptoalloteichus tenebrarius]|uniref:DNA-binding transcriptional regulator, MocR family, contains an aminotransferase domain n=1 Tax=Streptoalloteichus tenebrarius (strain ATCC 17920 / DSM 40477 / JCM 4838 / CBS 697.72 / NBRC 16177 / NCIMB 11028 / NRRL B-12390 / A12253. 1 / ISP 5477) TaxID=1933 RepID=A0ABT1HRS6_STRSD|nr:pyridoxal phosphate-dependent aminotransferase [Streptoalloteichus tenebrarius]MCP2258140.1 DNA-binding transcriptional regulator, MocR family, contains an aminotransferase domain [Streptoalloteichus tenebrarius]BFF04633.1 hypothetical protein GCM10020241_63080 [Streptoalloteichus tenebrarius]
MGSEPGLLDLTGAHRPWPAALRALWAECVAATCADPAHARTPPWRGEPGLAALLAGEVGSAEPVHVTAGVRALVPAFALLGRRVTIERPTYDGVRQMFERCGTEVRLDELDGFLAGVDSPERELLWITSPGRNPDGWTLDAATADRLGAFVAAGGIVVQNETYRWFAPEGPRVPGAYLVGSFTKLAGGWARTGWLVGDPVGPLGAALRSATPPTPWQAAWARFADAGGFAQLVARAHQVGTLTASAAALFGGAHGPSPTGASLLLRVPGEDPVRRLRVEARVLTGPGPAFGADPDLVRLSFLGCDGKCAHDDALRRIHELGAVLHTPPGPTARPIRSPHA